MDLHNPGNLHPVEDMFVILSRDKKGNEGLVAVNTPLGPQVAVTNSKMVLDFYMKQILSDDAKREAKKAGMQIVLTKFRRFKAEDEILL